MIQIVRLSVVAAVLAFAACAPQKASQDGGNQPSGAANQTQPSNGGQTPPAQESEFDRLSKKGY